MPHSQRETTRRVLVAKDSGFIYDEAYHELRMSLPEKGRTLHDSNLEKGDKEQEETRHTVLEEPNAREHET